MSRPEAEFSLPQRAYLRVGRWGKFTVLRHAARVRARLPHRAEDELPVRYIVGCGRSGTTVLSRALGKHPRACFVYEPYHIWERIDTRTDMTGFHSRAEGKLVIMDAQHFRPESTVPYRRLVSCAGNARRHDCVIEKTPINACRIGWIERLEADARYIHIVRNGLAVAESIERIVLRPTYRMANRPNYNQWWGENSIKWATLASDGQARGYAVGEPDRLHRDAQKAAYEWIVSLGEVDRWRSILGDRLMEVRMSDLVADPRRWLAEMAGHFRLGGSADWIVAAAATLRPERDTPGMELQLPPMMLELFNGYQDRYGFPGRAEAE